MQNELLNFINPLVSDLSDLIVGCLGKSADSRADGDIYGDQMYTQIDNDMLSLVLSFLMTILAGNEYANLLVQQNLEKILYILLEALFNETLNKIEELKEVSKAIHHIIIK